MPYLNDSETSRKIRQGDLSPTYLFYGTERYLLERTLVLLSNKASQEPKSFNHIILDGEKSTAEQIETAAETLPVMATQKYVCVQNFNPEKFSSADMERLKILVENPPDTCILVFCAPDATDDFKKSAKWKQFANAVASTGIVTEFSVKDKGDLARLLIERAEKLGCKLERPAALYLIEIVGHSLHALLGELTKLTDYAANRCITKQDIDLLVPRTVESSSFDLAKAILRGDYDTALHILDDLFDQRQEPLMILGALSASFLDLYRAKCAQNAGKSSGDIAAIYPYKGKEFRIKNALRDAPRFSSRQIAFCLHALLKADGQLKSSRGDNKIMLEQSILSMMLFAAKEAHI